MAKDTVGISLQDAIDELSSEVDDAVTFIEEEFSEDWEKAEKYFAGKVDAPKVKGRSTVVKTEVRDSVRALKPSILRTLLSARKIVEYIPNSVAIAPFVEQQATYVTQLFWASGGYKTIYGAVDESLKKKIGPVKTYWESEPTPEYFTMTGITQEDVDLLKATPDFDVEELTEHEGLDDDLAAVEDVPLFDVNGRKYFENGRIRMEPFPANEYFFSRNATSQDDAFTHGHRRDITVFEAMEMGLEHPNWLELDSNDEENTAHTEENAQRRGYYSDSSDTFPAEDLLNHKFTISEAYVRYDLKGTGRPQKYVFWLGGSSNTYIDHEEIDDWCIDLVEVDPVPFTPVGRSIADLTITEQDTMTSLLRAVVDNAHSANNPRHAANPMLVDFSDLMNGGIGSPIKTKADGVIQTIDTPFTGQALLPLIQYMEQDTENKVGVTKAAQGLDPNAMQSTDKQAVQNTIALSQGQVELIVRNIIETGLIPIFKRMLRLSVQHMDRRQVIRTSGTVIPINQAMFDPEMAAEPNVGLGTAAPEQKVQALTFILQKQEAILAQFGLDNPFTSLTQIYNTLEDLVELGGLYNVGRYFKVVTPEIEKKLAEQRAAAAAEAKAKGEDNTPLDPSKALLQIEQLKTQIKEAELAADSAHKAKELHLRVIDSGEKIDVARDRLVQDKELALIKVREDGRAKRASDRIARQQLINNSIKPAAPISEGSPAPSTPIEEG
jgi:hypothetical protein